MNRFDYIFPVRIHFGQGCNRSPGVLCGTKYAFATNQAIGR